MSLEKYAYLLDRDNLCVENKIFIDLMWYIARNKDNGKDKPKGMVTIDKLGRTQLKVKSYVIRNAGIMFQQIFYWHFTYLKKGKSTKYQYNKGGKMINVIKKDFEDWWEDIRLTDKEVTSANKFLLDTELVEIYKMRIKETNLVQKPCNCYALNLKLVEKYLDILTEISENVYKEKVENVRKRNIESSKQYKEKIKSTELSTNNPVTTVTGVTLNLESLPDVKNQLSTVSTVSTSENLINNPVTTVTGVTKESTVTGVTKESTVTGVTKESTVTDVTNKSDTTYKYNKQIQQNREETSSSPLSNEKFWDNVKLLLKNTITPVSYTTWIESSIKKFKYQDNKVILTAINNFSKEIIENRYKELIEKAIKNISGLDLNIEIEI
ncbi:DnaA N-terminal domain-containing protein [Clostridium cochlearium]|uniref:DnaA N-terminal domain-containing protein n=1 Tax=Clostridium cochlearium TaxID=1494 RepID=UPI00180554B0|nr:DnaA N-terminal domain-containing protein [Clostridium cochlearium]NMA58631.1 hypothetical protein [Clostridium cochlearium]